MAFLPRCPHRTAPLSIRVVSLLSRWSDHDILNGDITSPVWWLERRPCLAMLCQLHVRSLHLFSRESFFDVQVQTDKGKCNANRFGTRIGMLSRVRINDILMDE